MSDNWPHYVAKMLALRESRRGSSILGWQLEYLVDVVRRCEDVWAREDRISERR